MSSLLMHCVKALIVPTESTNHFVKVPIVLIESINHCVKVPIVLIESTNHCLTNTYKFSLQTVMAPAVESYPGRGSSRRAGGGIPSSGG